MVAVLLTMAVAWLVLSVLTTVVCTLIARGGLREDGRRGYLDEQPAWRDAAPLPAGRDVPRPRVTSG